MAQFSYPGVPTVFIIILNSKNNLFGSLFIEHVISLFLPSLGEIRLGYFGLFIILQNYLFWSSFRLGFSNMN